MTKVIDARGLEPPQPFEMAMDAIADLQKGDAFTLLLDRMPHPLLRLLDRDGYRYENRVQDDGTVEVRIEHP